MSHRWAKVILDFNLILLFFQSEVKRNGRVVQGYPPITEAQEEHEEDAELEEQEEQEAVTVSLLSRQKRAVNLRGAGEKSPMCGPSQKSVAQNSSRSRRKIQEITLNTLDPSNLSPRWVCSPLIGLTSCLGLFPCESTLCLFLYFFGRVHMPQTRNESKVSSVTNSMCIY